jgi:ribitol 2-dehydrogenase
MEDALASGSPMRPKEVADAVPFMLSRPHNVAIRALAILPNRVDL